MENKIKRYLDMVVDYMITNSKDNQFPFDNTTISFSDYCIQTFGLTDDEVDYVFHRYKFLMGWVSYDESKIFLKKILKNY